jgi:hypothetical protein
MRIIKRNYFLSIFPLTLSCVFRGQDHTSKEKALQTISSMTSAQIVSASAMHNKAAAVGLASLGLASPVSYPGAVSLVALCLLLLTLYYMSHEPHCQLCWTLLHAPSIYSGLEYTSILCTHILQMLQLITNRCFLVKYRMHEHHFPFSFIIILCLVLILYLKSLGDWLVGLHSFLLDFLNFNPLF